MNTGAWITIGLTILTTLISLGTLVYKYSQVVAKVEKHEEKITELKSQITKVEDNQKDYQVIITKSLDDIKTALGNMNTSIAVLSTKLELKEKKVEDDVK